MTRLINTSTPFQAFKLIMQHINDKGELNVSEDGDECLEIDTLIVRMSQPTKNHDKLTNVYCLGENGTRYYKEQLCEGKHIKKDNPDDEAEYTYFGRLNSYDFPECYDKVNQINNIMDKLKESPSTRRAVAVTWQPWIDIYSNDPPCMDFLKFNIRKNNLNLRVVFRSHDLLKGWPGNIMALSDLLESKANYLNLNIGFLEIVSYDGHVYIASDIDLFVKTLDRLNIKGGRYGKS